MSVAKEFEAANANYAASFAKGDLQLPPQRYDHLLLLETTPNKSQFNSKVAIVACMDARLDTARALGLEEGDAHVIRNAGGRVTDALRSIVISQQLLGTREIVIIHHTDCGMLTFTDDAIRTKIRDEIQQNADHIAFLPFSDLRKSVLDDVRLVKENPLVLDVPVTGYIYEVESGKIVKVE